MSDTAGTLIDELFDPAAGRPHRLAKVWTLQVHTEVMARLATAAAPVGPIVQSYLSLLGQITVRRFRWRSLAISRDEEIVEAVQLWFDRYRDEDVPTPEHQLPVGVLLDLARDAGNRFAAERLARELGCLPLALHLAGAT